MTSASIANAVSWSENETSTMDSPFARQARAAVMSPENDMSMPFTE